MCDITHSYVSNCFCGFVLRNFLHRVGHDSLDTRYMTLQYSWRDVFVLNLCKHSSFQICNMTDSYEWHDFSFCSTVFILSDMTFLIFSSRIRDAFDTWDVMFNFCRRDLCRASLRIHESCRTYKWNYDTPLYEITSHCMRLRHTYWALFFSETSSQTWRA